MKLKFIIKPELDFALAKNMGLPKERIKAAKANYQNSSKYLKQTQQAFQASWDAIGQDFSDYIEEATGHAWFHKQYQCVVSLMHYGVSNWGDSNIIFRTWEENPFIQRKVTAHELALSHYFHIYRQHYAKYGLSQNQVWALAEIAAFALTSLGNRVQDFWPWGRISLSAGAQLPAHRAPAKETKKSLY
jgi:hypothetical protein